MKYCVNVRRILREGTNIYVDADSLEEAMKKAKLEASSLPENFEWDCYDSECWVDSEEGVEEVE